MADTGNTEQMRDQALKEQAGKASKMIWVTFRKEGIHKYPAALDDPKLATGDRYDVSFLGHPQHIAIMFTLIVSIAYGESTNFLP